MIDMPSISHFSSNNLWTHLPVSSNKYQDVSNYRILGGSWSRKEAKKFEKSGPIPLSYHLLRLEVKAGVVEHVRGVRGSELRFCVLQLIGECFHGVRDSEFCHSSKNCIFTVTSSKIEIESKIGNKHVHILMV